MNLEPVNGYSYIYGSVMQRVINIKELRASVPKIIKNTPVVFGEIRKEEDYEGCNYRYRGYGKRLDHPVRHDRE